MDKLPDELKRDLLELRSAPDSSPFFRKLDQRLQGSKTDPNAVAMAHYFELPTPSHGPFSERLTTTLTTMSGKLDRSDLNRAIADAERSAAVIETDAPDGATTAACNNMERLFLGLTPVGARARPRKSLRLACLACVVGYRLLGHAIASPSRRLGWRRDALLFVAIVLVAGLLGALAGMSL